MAEPKVEVLNLPQAAALLGVRRSVVRELLYAAGLTPPNTTGGHWRAGDVRALAAAPTAALLEAQAAAPKEDGADRSRPRKRPKHIVPDPNEPETLDIVEVASILGIPGTPWEALLNVLANAGFQPPTELPHTWAPDPVHHLAEHPTAELVALRRRVSPAPVHCSTINAARLLRIGTRSVSPVMIDAGYDRLRASGHWAREDVVRLAAAPTATLLQVRDEPVQAPSPARAASSAPAVAIATARESPDDPLKRVIAHLGPTNSGKTHHALRALTERAGDRPDGVLVYAAPLRMMAQEAHAHLSAELGTDRVGLVTGEERHNVEAPVLCTTTELSPVRGDLLCLDEVQWCADPMRGAAWSLRLLNAEYREMRLIGPPDVLPVLRSVFTRTLDVVRHERLVPLHFVGPVAVDEVVRDSRRTVVIAFRRAAVLAIASVLQRMAAGREVGVLYGAMPLSARRHQMERVRSGEVGLVVSSDVLGHGVNLPCDRILFAETEKFDGRQHRSLHNYEIAQIAGRAGRYGLSDAGEVGVLTGLEFLAPDAAIIEDGLDARVEIEGFAAFRRVETMVEGPQLGDLAVELADRLPSALNDWYARARGRPRPGIESERPKVMVDRLAFVDEILEQRGSGLGSLTVDDAWRLARCRLSITDPADRAALFDIVGALDDDLPLPGPNAAAYESVRDLDTLEYAARYVDGLQWAAMAFPQLRLDAVALASCEALLAEHFAGFLDDLTGYAGRRCDNCMSWCSPVSRYCERCVEKIRRRREARQGRAQGGAAAA